MGRTTPDNQGDTRIPADLGTLMPHRPADLEVLRSRAAQLAREKEAGAQEVLDDELYVLFRLGADQAYGVPYRHLDEILYLNHIARVPGTPPFVAGVVNRRGELLTVLDVRALFRLPAGEYGEEARIIVVRSDGITAGLLVDGIEGNARYVADRLQPPSPAGGGIDPLYVLGVEASTITMLDIEGLLGDPRILIDKERSDGERIDAALD